MSLLAAVPTATTSHEPLKSSAAFKTRLSQAPPVQSAPSSVLEFPQWFPLPEIHTLPPTAKPSVLCCLRWVPHALGASGPHCSCCSLTKSCLTLSDPANRSTSGFPVLHCLPEFALSW